MEKIEKSRVRGEGKYERGGGGGKRRNDQEPENEVGVRKAEKYEGVKKDERSV